MDERSQPELQIENRVLRERIEQLKVAVAKWQPHAFVRVEAGEDGYGFTLSIAKGDGRGFLKFFTAEECAYYQDDRNSLLTLLAKEMVEKLYEDECKLFLKSFVEDGLQNVIKNEQQQLRTKS